MTKKEKRHWKGYEPPEPPSEKKRLTKEEKIAHIKKTAFRWAEKQEKETK